MLLRIFLSLAQLRRFIYFFLFIVVSFQLCVRICEIQTIYNVTIFTCVYMGEMR